MNEREYYVSRIDRLRVSKEIKQSVLQGFAKRKVRRQKTRLLAASLATVCVCLFVVIFSPAAGKVKAYCELAFSTLNEMIYGSHEDVSPYVTSVVQTDTDGDLTLQLDEVLLDGGHLICKYTVASNTPRFFTIPEKNDGAVYEGYYDIGIEKLTVNGISKDYGKDEISYDAFTEESKDYCTYPVVGEHCLHDLEQVLADPEELLKVEMDIAAIGVTEEGASDVRHFSYSFTIANRDLQLETREIPIDKTFIQDDVILKLDKMCINTHSQRIYFHTEGLPDREYRQTKGTDAPYDFILKGADDRGNEVFSSIEEIRKGYGYFELYSHSDKVGLVNDVKYYDFRMEYEWTDPAYVVCDDEHEGEWHGESGYVGDPFRVNCK